MILQATRLMCGCGLVTVARDPNDAIEWFNEHDCDIVTGAAKSQLSFAELVDELARLYGTDTPANIARRLGYSHLNSLARRLERAGLRDLARRFDQKDVAA